MTAFLAPLADAWWGWIAPLSVQIAVLAALFALVDRFVLRRSAVRVRTALAWAFFARLLLPPGLESPVSIASALPPIASLPESTSDLALVLGSIWFVGVLLAGSALARAIVRERRAWLIGTSRASDEVRARAIELARAAGLARAPRVLVHADTSGPAAVGFVRPVVVLPPRLAGSRLDHALLHEFAHVARRDALQGLCWSLARVVFWFHPAVHWAAAHAALLRELACDERAVRVLGDANRYRATLLAMADAATTRRSAFAPAFVPTGPQILARAIALDAALAVRGARASLQAAACFVLTVACVVPLARTTSPIVIPPLAELDGCLRTRYAVMAALAAESNARTELHSPRTVKE